MRLKQRESQRERQSAEARSEEPPPGTERHSRWVAENDITWAGDRLRPVAGAYDERVLLKAANDTGYWGRWVVVLDGSRRVTLGVGEEPVNPQHQRPSAGIYLALGPGEGATGQQSWERDLSAQPDWARTLRLAKHWQGKWVATILLAEQLCPTDTDLTGKTWYFADKGMLVGSARMSREVLERVEKERMKAANSNILHPFGSPPKGWTMEGVEWYMGALWELKWRHPQTASETIEKWMNEYIEGVLARADGTWKGRHCQEPEVRKCRRCAQVEVGAYDTCLLKDANSGKETTEMDWFCSWCWEPYLWVPKSGGPM